MHVPHAKLAIKATHVEQIFGYSQVKHIEVI